MVLLDVSSPVETSTVYCQESSVINCLPLFSGIGGKCLFFGCFGLVTKSCPTLQHMDSSMPGSSVLHYLPEFAQIHLHWVSDAILTISSSATLLCFCLQAFPASGSFPMSQLFASGGQSIGASTLASVLPMNIQDWFPLGLTVLISLLSKELSRVFSSTTIQKYQFFSA